MKIEGHLICHFTVSLQYFEFCLEESEEKCHAWISSLCEESAKRTIFKFFNFLEALEDFKGRQNTSNRNWYFSKRNMEKYQTAGRLVI